jgi:ribosomal protein L37AE/L43A
MGTPPATKSTLLIRSVHTSSEVIKATKSPNDEPACDRNLPTGNGSPKNMQIQTKIVQNSPRRIIGSAPQTPRKEKRPKRKGFLALLRKRLKSKRSRTSRESISMPSHELSSSIVEEDEEPNSANVSDSISSCSGRSSCCSEQSYHLYSWKGPLSASWESLKSISVQNLNVPLQTQEDADSLGDASGFSIASTTNSPLRGDFSNRGGIKSFTALILETIEDNETMYYLIPKHLAKKGKLKKRGTKLHICQDHMFLAKHIKSGGSCSVCQKKITARLGKKMYTCRDCGMICHKECFDKTQDICTQSTLQSLELLRGSTLFKRKGP